MIEHITGPYKGHYIAAYACPMGDLGKQYLGYFRICAAMPRSFFDDDYMREGYCEDICQTSASALRCAELQAIIQLDRLPAPASSVCHWGQAADRAVSSMVLFDRWPTISKPHH
ncbi:MAG: hypothetical protein JWQ07_109 [Ramlibacter sp.]|nr:hypothetical protein [Ramlibacter sp.]